MAQIEKYIQMLSSPKADTRYDACEQLRVSRESSDAVVIALEKASNDPEEWVADAAKHALEADVHIEVLHRLGRTTPKMQELAFQAAIQETEAKEFSAIIIVTTPSIDGKKVSNYLVIVSAEIVLGTGFLSDTNALISEVLGDRSNKFEEILMKAKNTVMVELRKKVKALQANAIIGVHIEYSVLSNNMLMVVAYGTAVQLELL